MAVDDVLEEGRLSAHFHFAAALPAVYRRLHACGTVGELFAQAAEMARDACKFDRAVILSLDGELMTATDCDALADAASDRLRRSVLRNPLDLGPADSLDGVAYALGLDHWATGTIASRERPLAVLVVDRTGLPVDDLDRAAVESFAAVVAIALESVVLRTRLAKLACQLRYVTTFTQALTAEMVSAPVELAPPAGHLIEFPSPTQEPGRRDRLREIFTERETEIAAFLVEGRSNRDIAARLYLSPETVKMHVAHILRKLDVTNRVEAATRLLATTQTTGDPPRSTSADVTLSRVYRPTRSGVATEGSGG